MKLQPFYTLTELAEILGVHEKTIARWLAKAGVTSAIDGIRLRRVAASELKTKCPLVWESMLLAADSFRAAA